TTPDFGGTFGPQAFDIHVGGYEVNSSDLVRDEDTGSITVDLVPMPSYVSGTFLPRTVKAGETAKFNLELSERDGAAILNLDPTRTRLSFSDGVHAPVHPLLDADSTTTIIPGAVTKIWFEDVLVPANYDSGFHFVNLRLVGAENGNDFDSTFVDFDSVGIKPPSVVKIDSLTSTQATVTAGQSTPSEWEVRMYLHNQGGSVVDVLSETTLNMRIFGVGDVTNDYTFVSDYTIEGTGSSMLGAGLKGAVVFTVTQTGPQTGQLRVDGSVVAFDEDAQRTVGDDTSDEGWVDLVVQTAAVLSMTAEITAPPDAIDGSVGTGQDFTLTATVNNGGQAAVDTTGQVTLILPEGFTVGASTPEVRELIVGDIAWQVFAPDTPSTSTKQLEVRITTAPKEINTDQAAAISDSSDVVLVDVEPLAALNSPVLSIIDPQGAQDDTVSTEQEFTFEGSVIGVPTTSDIRATLVPSPGSNFTVIDPLEQFIGQGTGERTAKTWRIRAPVDSARAEFYVRFDGFDANTTDDVEAFTETVLVVVKRKAMLTLSAEISAPPEATDGTVAVGTTFDISATVTNPPDHAGVDPASLAQLQIRLPSLPGDAQYTLVSGSEFEDFVIDSAVVWSVRAP
ncbi:MAG: hypothetical protein JSW50_00800, partial [Candidatus Latescibacterota bacterium]